MLNGSEEHNDLLRSAFSGMSSGQEEFWSFRGNSQREFGHGMLQYPAMMVPQLVRAILTICRKVHPELKSVGDPFVGSGTVLTEAMLQGFSFWGTDINPLSILSCKVKKGPFHANKLKKKLSLLRENIVCDTGEAIAINFKGIDKWFKEKHQIGLSKIYRSITNEPELWARRFFWLALAETVRYTSNSRTSTFKLHIRTQENIKERSFDVIEIFTNTALRNMNYFSSLEMRLQENRFIKNSKYINDIAVDMSDTRCIDDSIKSDIIITSPPYGDNETTVPYGQYSYLPLQWISLDDIDMSIDRGVLSTTHAIDSSSLGGSRRITSTSIGRLCDDSPSLARYLQKIHSAPLDRSKRVTSFLRDINDSLPKILSRLNYGGLLILVLGNRKVGGERVPFDDILTDFLVNSGLESITRISRRIPSKRMAVKNNFANTMSNESIIVMRKTNQ